MIKTLKLFVWCYRLHPAASQNLVSSLSHDDLAGHIDLGSKKPLNGRSIKVHVALSSLVNFIACQHMFSLGKSQACSTAWGHLLRCFCQGCARLQPKGESLPLTADSICELQT